MVKNNNIVKKVILLNMDNCIIQKRKLVLLFVKWIISIYRYANYLGRRASALPYGRRSRFVSAKPITVGNLSKYLSRYRI